jgi:hypothetical protein
MIYLQQNGDDFDKHLYLTGIVYIYSIDFSKYCGAFTFRVEQS